MTVAKQPNIPKPLLLDVSSTDLSEQLEQLRYNNPTLNLDLTDDGKLIVESKEIPQSTDLDLVELTPADTARRIEKIQSFREKERELWEGLSPEEQAASDRQFQLLHQSLAESRS
jgi:DNA-binding MarR family transcriptional regulator